MAAAVRALLGDAADGRLLMVGDRASTDGAFAVALGCPFALVRTGVTLPGEAGRRAGRHRRRRPRRRRRRPARPSPARLSRPSGVVAARRYHAAMAKNPLQQLLEAGVQFGEMSRQQAEDAVKRLVKQGEVRRSEADDDDPDARSSVVARRRCSMAEAVQQRGGPAARLAGQPGRRSRGSGRGRLGRAGMTAGGAVRIRARLRSTNAAEQAPAKKAPAKKAPAKKRGGEEGAGEEGPGRRRPRPRSRRRSKQARRSSGRPRGPPASAGPTHDPTGLNGDPSAPRRRARPTGTRQQPDRRPGHRGQRAGARQRRDGRQAGPPGRRR